MHDKSIDLLNEAISDELTAVHQYMYFHFHCEDQGFELLSGLFFRTALEEMRHVETLAERLLFLGGEVEMVVGAEVEKIHDVQEMVKKARALEEASALDYNKKANQCGENADSATKKIFEALVTDEERHFDNFDVEMENIKRFGMDYLAQQVMERSRRVASGTPAE